jgi:hypothetical protein
MCGCFYPEQNDEVMTCFVSELLVTGEYNLIWGFALKLAKQIFCLKWTTV